MKKIILPFIVFALAVILVMNDHFEEKNQKHQPQPFETIILDKEKEDGGKSRKEWIEQMHKAAPDVNWKKADLETRIKKAEYRKTLSKQKDGSIIVADGDLIGNWRETGSKNLSGRTHYVEYDATSDSIYCASSGGNIWKASKMGIGWRVLNDEFKIPDIKMIRKIPNGSGHRLLVSTGSWGIPGLWYSDDDANTWSPTTGLELIADWGSVIRTVVLNDENKTICLLAMEWDNANWDKATCIYISEDKGVSFTKKATYLSSTYGGEGNFDIWSDPDGTPIVYFVENNNVYYLDEAFSPVLINTVSYTSAGNILLSGCEIDSQTYLYIGVVDANATYFYQSPDAGNNWATQGSVPLGPFMKNSFVVSQKDPTNLYYGGMEAYRSQDGAASWVKVNDWGAYYGDIENNLHADIPGFNSFIDDMGEEFVYIHTDGGTYISFDQLENVQNISMDGLNVGQFYSVYSHRSNTSVIFGGSQDQGYQFCNNNDNTGTEEFQQVISGDYGHIVSGDGGSSVWMVYPGFAAYYPEAVYNPAASHWWNFTCSGHFWIPPLMEDPQNPNNVFLGGGTTSSGTHMFHLSYNSGSVSMNELDYDFSGTSGSSAISAMAYSPLDSDHRYVMNGEGEFFYSEDGGTNWSQTLGFDGPNGNYLYGASIIPSQTELGKVYVGGSGYSNSPVFVSTDHGANFTAIHSGIPNTMVFEMAITQNDEYLFAATEVGPYVYIPENNEWYDLAQDIAPDQTYWTLDYLPISKTVRFGTYGRGIWDFNIETGFVSLEEMNANSISIHPNPVVDILHIDSNSEMVEIYDLSGKLMTQTRENQLDVSEWKNGVYFVKTKGQTLKFVKM